MNNAAAVKTIKWTLVVGFIVACGTGGMGGVDSCDGFGLAPPIDDGAYYCADFVVKVDDQAVPGTQQHCDCVPTGQTPAAWLEGKCVLVESHGEYEFEGETITCEIQGSAVLVDSICTNSEDPPGVLDGTAGDDCGPPCDLIDPFTNCCCTVTSPMCCSPDDDACIGTVIGDPNFKAPGASPDYSVSLVSGQLDLTVHPSTGDEDSDSVAATATASYDFGDCGSDLCAFYLADLAFAASDTLSVDVTLSSVTKTKNIEDFEGRLLYPTFGTYDPSTDDVEFPPDTLIMSLRYEITGSEFDSENGTYHVIARNDQAVTGTANDSTHLVSLDDLSWEIDVPNVAPVAELSFSSISLVGRPPVVSATVSSVDCIAPNQGRVEFDSTSTDPDNDLSAEMWRIDGVLEHIGSNDFRLDFENGTHTYTLRAIDSRGAFRDLNDLIVVSCQ